MKAKAFAAIMLTLSLVTVLFYAVPIRAQVTEIKVGIMGPAGLIQGEGMIEGAKLAAEEIGTFDVDGTLHEFVLPDEVFDEFQGAADGTGETGEAAMTELVTWGADFAIGGFRSESVFGAREVAMDAEMIYLTSGAATNSIIWDPAAGAAPNIATDRERYKYIFRLTPVNSTALVSGVTGIWYAGRAGFVQYALSRLANIYGSPVKYATVVEAAVWAGGFYAILSNMSLVAAGYPDVYPYNEMGLADLYLGSPNSVKWPQWPVPAGHAELAIDPDTGSPAAYLVSPTATDLSAELAGIERSEARLVIHILSAELAGRSFTTAMNDIGLKAVAVGINVIEQMSEAWDETSGAVQYQTFLHTTGTRSPITATSTTFWDDYVTRWGRAPIYTAYGAYAGMYRLKEAIVAAGTIDPNAGPGHTVDGVFEGELIKQMELTDVVTATGRFKFTGPNGIYHDVYSESFGDTWTDEWVRTLMIQWQAGRHEVVYPTDQPYSKVWSLPDGEGSMYPYPMDVLADGYIELYDVLTVRNCYLAYPTAILDPPYEGPYGEVWQLVADTVSDDLIDIYDLIYVGNVYHWSVELPLAYDDEAGHLIPPP